MRRPEQREPQQAPPLQQQRAHHAAFRRRAVDEDRHACAEQEGEQPPQLAVEEEVLDQPARLFPEAVRVQDAPVVIGPRAGKADDIGGKDPQHRETAHDVEAGDAVRGDGPYARRGCGLVRRCAIV